MQRVKTAVMAFLAACLTVGALWFSHRAVTPKPATWDDVLAEAKAGGYAIMTTAELSRRFLKDAGSMLVVDTRQEWEYRTGHLQGAVNFPLEPTAWSRWRRGPALESFLGPDKDQNIIFY